MADGSTTVTSIPETGQGVTALMVRSALEIAEKDFKRRDSAGGTEALVRIQWMVIFQAAVSQYMAAKHPERSVPRLTFDLGAAVVAPQAGQQLLERPNNK